ncbi:MAG: TlpA family protein disulfide reductase [Deltaproteobacteria bacterium]|jgi:thiol-disulfide isomerase/thioredoxin|nr:TlpA family protein disulfide reductase [Deltaproteobacteria bacterium]
MKRFWIIILIAGFAFVALSAFQYISRPGRGDMAPVFSLPTLKGDSVAFTDFAGQPRIVHFWATWCGYCRAEFPSLNRLNDLYRDSGLMIFAISEDGEDGDDAVRYFLRETAVDIPILLDRTGKVADDYKSYGMPESLIVAPNGEIVERFTGAVNWDSDKVKMIIENMMTGKGVDDGEDNKSP